MLRVPEPELEKIRRTTHALLPGIITMDGNVVLGVGHPDVWNGQRPYRGFTLAVKNGMVFYFSRMSHLNRDWDLSAMPLERAWVEDLLAQLPCVDGQSVQIQPPIGREGPP